MMIRNQRQNENNRIPAIVSSSCSPSTKLFSGTQIIGTNRVNICSTNTPHAKKGTYLLSRHPQESTSVQNMFWLSSCLY